MKFKITEGSSIILAGVASYENVENSKSHHSKINWNFDFDFPKDINIDTEAIKAEAKKFKEEFKKQAPFMNTQSHTKEDREDSDRENQSDDRDFTFNFNDTMKDFGKSMERWGKGFEKTMKVFGETMEKFGEDLEKTWTGKTHSEDYDTWQLKALFDEMYTNSQVLQELDLSPKLYFEVVAYDLATDFNDQLKFIGCHISKNQNLPYNFVQQQLRADKWLIIKLTEEEYEDDWMNKVIALDELKPYTLEQYFIIRHFKDTELAKDKKIKLFVPLKSL